MINNFSNYLKITTLVFISALLFNSCASTKSGKSDNPFTNSLTEASEYIYDGNKPKAKATLLEALKMDHIGIPTSPYVKDSTLVIYINSTAQNIIVLMMASSVQQMKDSIGVINSPFFKMLDSIWTKSHWNQVVTVEEPVSNIYLLLGILTIDENNIDQAINYLDSAVMINPGLGRAWSEMMYAYGQKNNWKKAKEIGLAALNYGMVEMDKSGQAGIYRKLGYIAVEESDFNKAEEYYNKSLELEESDVARKELKYIQQRKDQKKIKW